MDNTVTVQLLDAAQNLVHGHLPLVHLDLQRRHEHVLVQATEQLAQVEVDELEYQEYRLLRKKT